MPRHSALEALRKRQWYRQQREKLKLEYDLQDQEHSFDAPKAEDDKSWLEQVLIKTEPISEFDFEDATEIDWSRVARELTAGEQREVKNETDEQDVKIEPEVKVEPEILSQPDIKVEPDVRVEPDINEHAPELRSDQIDQSIDDQQPTVYSEEASQGEEQDQTPGASEQTFDVVAVDVGTGATRETFKIVKSRAMAVSRFFWSTLRISDGSIDQSISLPEIEPDIFEYFQDFLRLGIVVNREDVTFTTSVFHDYQYSKSWSRLAKAWLLGEFLQSIPFRDAVVDAIIRKLCEGDQTPLDLFAVLYRPDIDRKACIKRLLIDIAVWTWDDDVLAKESIRDNLREHPDFLFDFMEVLARVRWEGLEGLPFFMRNTCMIYHEHVEEHTVCYRDWDRSLDEAQEQALQKANFGPELSKSSKHIESLGTQAFDEAKEEVRHRTRFASVLSKIENDMKSSGTRPFNWT